MKIAKIFLKTIFYKKIFLRVFIKRLNCYREDFLRVFLDQLENPGGHKKKEAANLLAFTLNLCFVCIFLLIGCSTGNAPNKPTAMKSNEVPIDVVSKIVEYTMVDNLTLSEKFEIYFQEKIEKYDNSESSGLFFFKSIVNKEKIFMTGIDDGRRGQSATVFLRQIDECISPQVLIKKLPKLESHPESSTHMNWDAESLTNAFYNSYVFKNKLGYFSFYFENDKCLRWIGASQKLS